MNAPAVQILAKGCVCGHDHRTSRDERVELCLQCSCECWTERCQNCGEEALGMLPNPMRWDACSLRCLAQLDYAKSLTKAAA